MELVAHCGCQAFLPSCSVFPSYFISRVKWLSLIETGLSKRQLNWKILRMHQIHDIIDPAFFRSQLKRRQMAPILKYQTDKRLKK